MVAPQVSCPPVVSLRYIMYQPPASVWRRRQGEAWGGGGGPGMSRAVFGGSVQPPGGFAEGGMELIIDSFRHSFVFCQEVNIHALSVRHAQVFSCKQYSR